MSKISIIIGAEALLISKVPSYWVSLHYALQWVYQLLPRILTPVETCEKLVVLDFPHALVAQPALWLHFQQTID